MTLFLNAHSDRIAPGSFQQPVPIPANRPGSPDFVQVCFNKDWLPYVLTCLFQLTLSTTWQAATQSDLMDAFQKANDLILIFQRSTAGCNGAGAGSAGASEDYMLRQNPDNPCELQSSVDGITWCTWADLSKCSPNPQPGSGTIQPVTGGCREFTFEIAPTSPWLLPVTVNAGDTVKVSLLDGAWSPSAFTEVWLCPDGNLFFAGFCVDGTQAFDGGAPMPTAPLNGTILFDGTNYYDVSAAANLDTPVTITILPGVSNAQLIVRCNFHGGVEPAGTVKGSIQVCNNQLGTFDHTFDLSVSSHGWIGNTEAGVTPSWLPGGFVGAGFIDAGCGGSNDAVVGGIHLEMPVSRLITEIRVKGNTSTNHGAGNGLRAIVIDGGSPISLGLDSSVGNFDVTIPINLTAASELKIELNSICFASSPTTQISLVEVRGAGTDPF